MSGHVPLSAALPQFFPRHWLKPSCDIVHSDFPSRIRIGYVLRIEGGYSYVMREAFDSSGLQLEELHELALKNLRALPMPDFNVAETPGGSEAWLSDTVDNFTAARILLPSVRRALARKLGPEHFAAIPCRDWFICWSARQQADFQAKNVREARDIFLRGEYNLTPDILLVTESGFKLHTEQSV